MKKKTKKIIIIAVIVIILLILGLVLTRTIFTKNTPNVNLINKQMIKKINDLFQQDKSKRLIFGITGERTFSVKSGTENFGIPIAFAPNNSQAWGMNGEGCKYDVQAVNQAGYCINQGWSNAGYDVNTGTSIVTFDMVNDGIGYALIKINVPKNLQPCTQRFTVEIKCNIYPENTKDYFDLEVI